MGEDIAVEVVASEIVGVLVGLLNDGDPQALEALVRYYTRRLGGV